MSYMTDKEIGQVIKRERLRRDWTQTELGERLGVGAAAINKWELGTVTNIKRDMLRKISVTLNINPATLIGIRTDEFTTTEQKEIEMFISFVKSKRETPCYKKVKIRRKKE